MPTLKRREGKYLHVVTVGGITRRKKTKFQVAVSSHFYIYKEVCFRLKLRLQTKRENRKRWFGWFREEVEEMEDRKRSRKW